MYAYLDKGFGGYLIHSQAKTQNKTMLCYAHMHLYISLTSLAESSLVEMCFMEVKKPCDHPARVIVGV